MKCPSCGQRCEGKSRCPKCGRTLSPGGGSGSKFWLILLSLVLVAMVGAGVAFWMHPEWLPPSVRERLMPPPASQTSSVTADQIAQIGCGPQLIGI